MLIQISRFELIFSFHCSSPNDIFNIFPVPKSLASRFLRDFHWIVVKADDELTSSVNNSRRRSSSGRIITRNYYTKQVLSAGNHFHF